MRIAQRAYSDIQRKAEGVSLSHTWIFNFEPLKLLSLCLQKWSAYGVVLGTRELRTQHKHTRCWESNLCSDRDLNKDLLLCGGDEDIDRPWERKKTGNVRTNVALKSVRDTILAVEEQ